jgi:hypothetical protein
VSAWTPTYRPAPKPCAPRPGNSSTSSARSANWPLRRPPQVGSYPQRYPLHVDDGSDPDRLVAHACRELAALRHALDESSGSTDRDEGR